MNKTALRYGLNSNGEEKGLKKEENDNYLLSKPSIGLDQNFRQVSKMSLWQDYYFPHPSKVLLSAEGYFRRVWKLQIHADYCFRRVEKVLIPAEQYFPACGEGDFEGDYLFLNLAIILINED